MPASEADRVSSLRTSRMILAISPSVYLVWWILSRTLLPTAFNPLGSRLAVVAVGFGIYAASYGSTFVARHLSLLWTLWATLLTAHYFYLVDANHGDAAWWAGALITVAACASFMVGRGLLIFYSVVTVAIAVGVAKVEGQAAHSVFPPGIATILLVSNLSLSYRIRAEHERRLKVQAEKDRDQAKEASRLKTMFLGLVGHELVTPLQAVQLHIDLLAGAKDMKDVAGRVPRIERSVRRLRELIETLLDYARAESGMLDLRFEPCNIEELASEVIGELAPQAAQKSLAISLTPPPQPLQALSTDRALLKTLIKKLVTNAVQYTEAGAVAVSLSDDPDAFRIAVTDSGAGIAEEDRERIFDPFTQLTPLQHKHAPGVGLGLALVKELANAIGAQVELRSKLGEGSTFTVVVSRRDVIPSAAQ